MSTKRPVKPQTKATTNLKMPSPEEREARLKLGEAFLDKVIAQFILQAHAGHSPLLPSEVEILFHSFRKENEGPGDSFDLSITWSIALQRTLVYQCEYGSDVRSWPESGRFLPDILSLLNRAESG